jgi:hypothetical protein
MTDMVSAINIMNSYCGGLYDFLGSLTIPESKKGLEMVEKILLINRLRSKQRGIIHNTATSAKILGKIIWEAAASRRGIYHLRLKKENPNIRIIKDEVITMN